MWRLNSQADPACDKAEMSQKSEYKQKYCLIASQCDMNSSQLKAWPSGLPNLVSKCDRFIALSPTWGIQPTEHLSQKYNLSIYNKKYDCHMTHNDFIVLISAFSQLTQLITHLSLKHILDLASGISHSLGCLLVLPTSLEAHSQVPLLIPLHFAVLNIGMPQDSAPWTYLFFLHIPLVISSSLLDLKIASTCWWLSTSYFQVWL